MHRNDWLSVGYSLALKARNTQAWGNALFLRVKKGELNLRDSKREIDNYVQTHLILNKEIAKCVNDA